MLAILFLFSFVVDTSLSFIYFGGMDSLKIKQKSSQVIYQNLAEGRTMENINLDNWFEVVSKELENKAFKFIDQRLVLDTADPVDCWLEVDNPYVFFYFRKPSWDRYGRLETFIVSAGDEGVVVKYNTTSQSYPLTQEFLLFLRTIYDNHFRKKSQNNDFTNELVE